MAFEAARQTWDSCRQKQSETQVRNLVSLLKLKKLNFRSHGQISSYLNVTLRYRTKDFADISTYATLAKKVIIKKLQGTVL